MGNCVSSTNASSIINNFKDPIKIINFEDALFDGNMKMVKYHLDLGADMESTKNIYNMSALSLAANQKQFEVCEYLIKRGANVNAKDRLEWFPLIHALSSSSFERSSWFHKEKTATLLLDNGADIETKYETGKTFLIDAADKGSVQICKFLVAKGANVNAKDNTNRTPLMFAARRCSEELIDLFITNGADIKHTGFGGSAYDYASRSKCSEAILERLDCA